MFPRLSSTRAQVLRDAGWLLLLAAAYGSAAHLSLGIALVHGQVTPIWPPTGIALFGLLVLGRRAAAAIAIASLAVNLPIGPSPLAAAGIALGDTLAPLLAAELLKLAGFHLELDRLKDAVLIICLGALAGMLVSATVGSEVLVLAGAIRPDAYWQTWAVWWTGDAMGVLLVAPFLLSLRRRTDLPPLRVLRSLELGLLLLSTGIAAFALFRAPLGLEYLVFPLIMVAAWRFRLRGAAPAALITSAVAIWTAVHGAGPFAGLTVLERMIALQVFNTSVATASFVLAAFADARERREEALRLYEAARLTAEAKSSFLNMAAHELRTPLAVINGYLSLIAEGTLGQVPAAWRRPTDILLAKTHELNKIVDDLLQASRIVGADAPDQRRHTDLGEIVRSAAARAQPRAELLGATVSVDVGSERIPVEVNADQVARILDNLINNGLAYSRSPADVAVRSYVDRECAMVRVSDHGVGIPESARQQVFDCFFRGEESMLAGLPGSGLGLYISRQLAEAHGGSLVLESSEVGVGSRFLLALPLAGSGLSEAGTQGQERTGVISP